MHESVYGSQLLCNCCVLLGNKVGIACVNRHRSVRARLCAVAMCSRFKVQGFFICHIIVIQGIIRSEM